MSSKKRQKNKQPPNSKASNLVSVVALIVLGALSVLDLQNTQDTIPTFIYYGLIGAALGAKIDDIKTWFGGSKR